MTNKDYLYEGFNHNLKLKHWSDDTIDKIISLQFPDFKNIDWEPKDQDKKHREYLGGCLRHGTPTGNIESILESGLDIDNKNISHRSNGFLWAANPLDCPGGIEEITHSYYGNSIIFTVPDDVPVDQVNSSDFTIYGKIPVENIVSIDIPIIEYNYGETYFISDIISIIDEYFEGDYVIFRDKCRKNKSGYLSDDQYDAIFEWYADYIKKPNRKINESLKSSPCMKLKEWMTVEGLRNRDATSDFTTNKRQIRQMYYGGENRNARLTNCYYNPGKDTLTFEFKTIPTYKDHEPDYEPKITDPFDDFKLKPIVNDRYTMYIQIIDFMKWLGTRPADAGNITRKELNDIFDVAYVKVFCNCPSFHWQAANYNASQLDASIYPTDIPPKKWGKVHGEYSCLCKHLSALLKQFYFFEQQMSAKASKCLRLAGYIK